MTSRYRGENAVPFSLKGVGIAPTIELSVVIGMGIPVLSFPRFHGFRQTNRTSWFAIAFLLLSLHRLGAAEIASVDTIIFHSHDKRSKR